MLPTGRCCLEIGCGAGMVGVALHRAGAAHTILTDGNPGAVSNCRRNLLLNGLPLLPEAPLLADISDGDAGSGSGSGSRAQRWVECRQLCWEDGWPTTSTANVGSSVGDASAMEAQQAQQQGTPTVVLGADLLYDPTVIPVLLGLLKQVLSAAEAAAARSQPPAADGRQQQQAHQQHEQAEQQQKAQPVQQHPAQQQQPAAYLATTLRNEATLQQFLAAADADPDICIEQLAPGASSACKSTGGSCSHVTPPLAPAGASVCFQHLPELAAARGRIFLHRITLALPCC